MSVQLRILITAVPVAIALWVLFDTKESNLQPLIRRQVKLWLSGFAVGVSVSWLISGGVFTDDIWIKMLTGVVGGFLWTFRLARLLQHTANLQKKGESQDNQH